MKKKIALAIVGIIIFSSVCYAGDFIEIGASMVWNPIVFRDTAIGGGVNLAVLPKFTDHFGIGLFFGLAFSPDAALFDFLIGPHFEFNINDKVFVIPCAGVYMGMIFFGFGGNLTVQYAVHPHISLFARVQYAYATFMAPGVNSIKTSIVSPSIGVGYKF